MGITIIGCGLGPEDLTAKLRERIGQAAVLAGGRRLLDWFPGVGRERVVLGAGSRATAELLLARAGREDGEIVVLASGDPLFFGIAGTFFELAAALPEAPVIEVRPNVSSLQAAAARLRIDWSGLAFFNLHGRRAGGAALPWPAILRAPAGALLLAGGGENAAQALAAALCRSFPPAAGRPAAVLSELGRPGRERIVKASLGEIAAGDFSALSLLYLAPPSAAAGPAPPLPLGLATAEFAHEAGLITKPEVRAAVLAGLRLVPGVLWDLGSGSGSVAVEAALLQPGLKVLAVERRPERCALIRANAEKFGAEELEVINRAILEALPGLPEPDRVFVGGGGGQVAGIAAAAFARLRPGGRLLAAAVTLESRAALNRAAGLPPAEVVEITVARSRPLNGLRLLKGENPVGLYCFMKV